MASNIQNDIDDSGAGFDAIAFANSIYEAINPKRSQFGADYTSFMENPASHTGTVGETNFNTFLRILGLPATRDTEFLSQLENTEACQRLFDLGRKKATLSQDDTLNFFDSISAGTSGVSTSTGDADLFQKLRSRNAKLTEKIDTDKFKKFMSEPISFMQAVEPNPSGRISIFPLVVDAAVPIYPLSRRTAPSFFIEDYTITGSTTPLSRPFIDNVIYIRTKIVSGDVDQAALEELQTKLTELAEGTETQPGNTELNSALQSATDFSLVELRIYERFIQTIKKLASEYAVTIKRINQLSSSVTFAPSPVTNAEQKSGDSTTVEEKQNLLTVPDLEMRIDALKKELVKEEALLYIMPNEQIQRRANIRRIEHSIPTKNMSDDILMSNFTDLITFNANKLRKEIEEAQNEKEQKIQEMEVLKRNLLYYTGQFNGLSIFDVICILYGLFTVEFKYLIGLLNTGAQNRLMLDDFFVLDPEEQSPTQIEAGKNPAQLIAGGSVPRVNEALTALEAKVKEAFLIASAFAEQI